MMASDGNMDDLADSLASSFAVSNNPNDPSRPHPRFSMYKSHGDQVRRNGPGPPLYMAFQIWHD
jgi:hypothetical protein